VTTFFNAAVVIGVLLLVAGLLVYAAFLIKAFWLGDTEKRKTLDQNLSANVGIPGSAFAAFGVVVVLYLAFPPEKLPSGEIKISAFDLSFTGPSGPVLLWVVCFLSFIAALKVLRQ
jgi:hypothetical protein